MGDVLKIRDEYRQVQWAAAIQECRASGLSNKEYCIQHGLSDSRPRFPPYIVTGRVRAPTYWYKPRSVIVCVTDDKKSLADWRDFSVCVGITYLPGKSPCKYCRRR